MLLWTGCIFASFHLIGMPVFVYNKEGKIIMMKEALHEGNTVEKRFLLDRNHGY